MTQKTRHSKPSGMTSQALVAIAGPPPLISGEKAPAYDDLLARVTDALAPSDVLEHIWIRDVVDLVWEVFRLRRIKANLMAAAVPEGMVQVLSPLRGGAAEKLTFAWAAREQDDVEEVETTLANVGLTMDHVAASGFSARIGDFERIDRMLADAEERRSTALHALHRHRAGLALRLRSTLQEIEDAELEVIAPARENAA